MKVKKSLLVKDLMLEMEKIHLELRQNVFV